MIKWKYTGDTKIYTGVKKIPPEKAVKKFYFPLDFFRKLWYSKKREHIKKVSCKFIKVGALINTPKMLAHNIIEVQNNFFICSVSIIPHGAAKKQC